MVQEGRSRGRSGDMPVASLQDQCVGIDNHRRSSMSASARSMNIRACVVDCTRGETRRYRLSYKGLLANACIRDCGVDISTG